MEPLFGTDRYFLSIFVLLAFVFTAGYITRRALKKLDTASRSKVAELLSGAQIFTFILMIVFVIGQYFIVSTDVLDPIQAGVAFTIVLVVTLFLSSRNTVKKLRANNFPSDFIAAQVTSTNIRAIGILIYFGLILYF